MSCIYICSIFLQTWRLDLAMEDSHIWKRSHQFYIPQVGYCIGKQARAFVNRMGLIDSIHLIRTLSKKSIFFHHQTNMLHVLMKWSDPKTILQQDIGHGERSTPCIICQHASNDPNRLRVSLLNSELVIICFASEALMKLIEKCTLRRYMVRDYFH